MLKNAPEDVANEAVERAEALRPPGNWSVYMIATPQGNTYVGCSTDPNRRVAEHNRETGHVGRGAKSTKGRGPWELVYVEDGLPDRRTAMSREYYVKKDRSLRRRLVKEWMQRRAQVDFEP